MKKIIFLSAFLGVVFATNGQILKKITDKVKNKTESKANNKIDSTVNKNANDGIDGNNKGEKKESTNENNPGTTKNESGNPQAPSSIKTYSKYDFVPGEKIIVYEDFMQDAVGDLPSKWNTNSAGETVTLEGKPGHWFMLTKPGVFMPDFIDSLPENFTLEFDVFADAPAHSWGITTAIAQLNDRNKPEDWRNSVNSFSLNLLPGINGNGSSEYERTKNSAGEAPNKTQISHFKDVSKPVHVSIWRQKERLRVYLNEDKTWDVPKAILPEAKLNAVVFEMQLTDNWHFLITNIRLATGAPDTRNKILTQNKWVTHGILFDVNSATIKPESYGTLKEMATVLKENPDLKVKIVGHTDADGNDAANLDLSKKRAASVKDFLVKEFGIDESRMQTDGKGEGEPIDKNDTPAGKANNRRVEFIKI